MALDELFPTIAAFLIGLIVGGLVVWLSIRAYSGCAKNLLRLSAWNRPTLIEQLQLHTKENNRLSGEEGERAHFEFVTSEALLSVRIDEIVEAIDDADSYNEAYDKARVIPFPSREEPEENINDPRSPEDKLTRRERIKGKASGVKDKALKVANQKLQSTVKRRVGEDSEVE